MPTWAADALFAPTGCIDVSVHLPTWAVDLLFAPALGEHATGQRLPTWAVDALFAPLVVLEVILLPTWAVDALFTPLEQDRE